MTQRTGLEIAVIGLSGRFPGAGTVEEFWKNLRQGERSIRFFSPEELAAAGVGSAMADREDYVPANGLLEDLEYFDASFFGIPPREAEIMDPQQRIFLQCAWHSLENAGYDPQRYGGSVGVYAGTSLNTYLSLDQATFRRLGSTAGVFQLLMGNDRDFLTTRVAYKLNLRGPGVVVQTACSTSLVAVHLACRALLGGECDMALAGGVSARVPQESGYLYQEGGILSPDGYCRAFDARAQGTVPGSGVGIVVLKRLEDAEEDGDTIHAIIKGSAINNDGSLKVGYTAPSIEGQAAAIRAAQLMAEVEPETISYIEAHGTGTPLGDPIEVSALKRVFRESTERKGFCGIGSVKTNIGHLDAAAGIAGLIKTIQALRHRELPPSLHFEEPNPKLGLADSPFYVNDRLRPWEAPAEVPLRAGVSSFGIGGTNCHLVLEEAPVSAMSGPSRKEALLLVSAKSPDLLDEATERLARGMRQELDSPLADVAHTLAVGRGQFRYRRAVVARNREDATEALSRMGPGRAVEGEVDDDASRGVAFLFPGQGTQRPGMGQAVYAEEPVFREAMDRCFKVLEQELGEDPRTVIWDSERGKQLQDTQWAQCSLLAVEWSLAQLWRSWGVEPTTMIGHSLGEYVAACLAGVLEVEDALRLIALRGRLMALLPEGSMLMVPLPEEEVGRHLDSLDPKGQTLALAAVNGPALCVVSGPHGAVDTLEKALASRETEGCRRLHVSHAFHSPMMDPILDDFGDAVSRLDLRAPSRSWISNVTGRPIRTAEATDPGYWVRHLRHTVRFADGIDAILQKSADPLLEVGPGKTLTTLARRHPEFRDTQRVFASLRPAVGPGTETGEDGGEVTALRLALGGLWTSGVTVDWKRYYDREARRRVPLPAYPFARQRYWLEHDVRQQGVPPAPLVRKDDLERWFYLPQWRRDIRRGTVTVQHRPCLVFLHKGDRGRLGAALAEALEAAGHPVVRVFPGKRFERRGDHSFTVAMGNREHYAALWRAWRQEQAAEDVVSLVYLWTLDPEDEDSTETVLESAFYSLLALAQAVVPAETSMQWTVVGHGMHEVTGDETLRPAAATAIGPCLVVPQEMPWISCRCLDIEPPCAGADIPEDLVKQLTEEILDPECWEDETAVTERIAAFRGAHRWLPTYPPWIPGEAEDPPPSLRRGGVYLITGGLGGLGLALAQFLGEAVGARLVLLSRSGFAERDKWSDLAQSDDEDAARTARGLQRLEEVGAEVLVARGDVADRRRMVKLREEIEQRFGALHGILHAAGTPPKSLIQRKTREMAQDVLRPKVQGTRVLLETLAYDGLDFFFLFSSLRALTGGVGTADYTAANAFLDTLAHDTRRRLGLPVLSIDWDGWREVGMGITEDEEGGMTTDEGIEVFRRLLHPFPGAQAVICFRDLDKVIQAVRSSTLDHGASAEKARQERPEQRKKRYPRPDLANSYAPPGNATEETLAEIWQDLLGLEKVGVEDNLFDLGGDSVISIRMVARATEAGLRLTPAQAFQHQTIAELAAAAGGGSIQAEQGPVEGPVALTPIQHWFFELETPDPEHWNQAVLLATEELDPAALETAAQALLTHHDALRLRYSRKDTGWSQRIVAPEATGPVPLERIDLSGEPPESRRAVLEATAAEAQASLDLEAGPIVRWIHFHLGQEAGDRLLWVLHHLAVDVIAWRTLLEDLETAYRQAEQGDDVTLPAKTTSLKHWARRLEEHARTGGVDDERPYWLGQAEAVVPPLPRDYPEGANLEASAETVHVSLGEEYTRAVLQEIPRVYQTQINEALLAALLETFVGWTGERRLRVDLEGHGREAIFDDVDVSRTVGWFTTVFPVILETPAGADVDETLLAVKEQMGHLPERGFGYGMLRYLHDDVEIRRRLKEGQEAEISFLYLGQSHETGDPGDGLFAPTQEKYGPTQSPRGQRPYLLQINSRVLAGKLEMDWVYSHDVYERPTVEDLAASYLDSLRRLVEASRTASADDRLKAQGAQFGWSQDDVADILSKLVES